MKAICGFLMACSLACASALAQTPTYSDNTDNNATNPTSTPTMRLSPTTENGISYVCGGIGSTEAAQMKRSASRYQLMLTFAENTGAYLASVDVGIADARGNSILQTTCDAPIMLVNFPRDGTYRINAEVDGIPVNRVVRINSGTRGNSVALLWPRRMIERRTGNMQG